MHCRVAPSHSPQDQAMGVPKMACAWLTGSSVSLRPDLPITGPSPLTGPSGVPILFLRRCHHSGGPQDTLLGWPRRCQYGRADVEAPEREAGRIPKRHPGLQRGSGDKLCSAPTPCLWPRVGEVPHDDDDLRTQPPSLASSWEPPRAQDRFSWCCKALQLCPSSEPL